MGRAQWGSVIVPAAITQQVAEHTAVSLRTYYVRSTAAVVRTEYY